MIGSSLIITPIPELLAKVFPMGVICPSPDLEPGSYDMPGIPGIILFQL